MIRLITLSAMQRDYRLELESGQHPSPAFRRASWIEVSIKDVQLLCLIRGMKLSTPSSMV